MSFSLID